MPGLRALPLALIGAMTTGCYTTTLVLPQSLPYLAGNASFVVGEDHPVQDLDGKVVMIGEQFTVKLDPRPDLPAEWARWSEAMRAAGRSSA